MNKKTLIWITLLVTIATSWLVFNNYRIQNQTLAIEDLETEKIRQGNLSVIVGATGTVRSNQSATLTWKTTGTVAFTNLDLGDRVVSDQILAGLLSTSLPPNIILAEANLVEASKQLDQLLYSQTQQAQAMHAVEDAEQALEDVQNPELDLSKAQSTLADAQKNFVEKQQYVEALTSPAPQSAIDQSYANMLLAKNALDKTSADIERVEKRQKNGIYKRQNIQRLFRKVLDALQTRLIQRQIAYQESVRKYENLTEPIDPTDIALAEAGLALARAQLQQDQREWERVKDGPSPADVSLLEAQLADAEREYERLKDGADPNDIAATEARIAAAQATINQAYITAPFNGTITNVITKPGDQVSPGSIAFRLDDLSRLLVDVQVSEVDINQIASGQPATLTFDSVPAKEYDGTVVEVASVGEIQQGVVNFKVTVALSDPEESIKPGMTAAVNFVIDQLEDVLLIPNRAVRIVDGKRVVYVLRSNTPQAVAITLGASSGTVSQILDDKLQVGDIIVLNPTDILQKSDSVPAGD